MLCSSLHLELLSDKQNFFCTFTMDLQLAPSSELMPSLHEMNSTPLVGHDIA
jgi:hypothetical protein